MRLWNPFLFIVYFVILTVIVGCDELAAPVVPPQSLWENEYIHVNPECSPIYDCQFIVTVGPFNQEENFDIQLHADYGVDFTVDGNFPNIVSTDNHTSTVASVHLQQHGTRVIRFPFTFNSQATLAGEYVVMVQLLGMGGEDEASPAHKLKIKAFVYIGEHGKVRLMKNQSEFNAEYKDHYTTVNDLDYAIRLESGDRPIHGKIFIKVTANHDEYDPVLTLYSEGGVEFKLFDPVAICADEGGSRILVFTFRVIEGAYQSDGRYVFAIFIQEDTRSPIHEILPIAVKLSSEANTHQNQWMELVYGIPTSSVSTLVPENDVNSGTGYSKTVSTGNVEDCDPPPSVASMLNNGEQIPAVDDASIGGVHGSGDPNVAGGTPDIYFTEEFTGGRPDDSLCDNWQSIMSNEQALSLGEAYQQYVVDNNLDMTPDVFVTGFRLCNGVPEGVGNVTLYGGKPYQFPTGNDP